MNALFVKPSLRNNNKHHDSGQNRVPAGSSPYILYNKVPEVKQAQETEQESGTGARLASVEVS